MSRSSGDSDQHTSSRRGRSDIRFKPYIAPAELFLLEDIASEKREG